MVEVANISGHYACNASPHKQFNDERYVIFAMLGFLSITGIMGNALVFAVYHKKRDQQTSTLFILTLAVVDFFTCLVNVPLTLCMEYLDGYIQSDFLCKFYHFIMTSSVPFSSFIMAAIAVDRYVFICHPFSHLMNLTRAKLIVVLLAAVAALEGLIVCLCYGVTQLCPVVSETGIGNGTNLDTKNETLMVILDTGHCTANTFILGRSVRKNFKYFHICLYILSLVVVVVLYSLLYKSLLERRAKRQKQKAKLPKLSYADGQSGLITEETELNTFPVEENGTEKIHLTTRPPTEFERRRAMEKARDRQANIKTAAMLFVVAVVFIISFFPAMLITSKLLTIRNPDLAKIFFYFYFLNHVANPVIYSFMNQNFRDDMRKLLNCSRNPSL
ncbi:cholecystokinin receptor type A [Lingula anatina]|uniref:Cholecystokinin receptor type A n=1 Tax=Lingula anatina TaxID=7574 RepID=A0A1S3HH85_LINAN|nr:cholecystokinin receptor type A [Lingula anatina]XP_013385392.1 cholecystokinin receptor type A [Lingula anatina]XP_013385393.1 cholecystokinin receptor type A [Lingula anatina]XP_013385394.1 cholecystokinin receptor type A [Lingula anatina]XP_013385395.1 cholecystokinin receptor type A [Lingula anatina]XP_013385396.1 cholecystokinin receptor type A [Lingula anatina]XP_013385397.1 cholecystokinin receptor type A [Lingula anatina]XP_013385398.1 cholecystokinin receptor type A [Lingula anat|eukprot:XP_013385391.1 cholecystokinin receptor type A [Lingula anatina]